MPCVSSGLCRNRGSTLGRAGASRHFSHRLPCFLQRRTPGINGIHQVWWE